MSVEVVIVVPGIMGSELWDGKQLVWPGRPYELLLPYAKMEQLRKPDLQATDIIRNVSISSQYSVLVEALETCGFHETSTLPTLFVCPYDWRKKNEESAETLAGTIERAADLHSNDCEINLICHSMGGLIARYYLESGDFAARRGFDSVRRLIALATPHRGAPMALLAAVGQEKRLFLNRDQVKEIANDPRYPSLYQLLPPSDEPFAWHPDPEQRFLPVDIYDPDVANGLGLSADNLRAARAFHQRLRISRRPELVRYFFFAGTQQETVCDLRVDHRARKAERQVRRVEREDAGDGTVPVWSAMLTGIQTTPVGGEHGGIYKGALLQRVLSTLLGKKGLLSAELPSAELAVRNQVVEAGGETRAVLTLATPAESVDGQLRLVRIASRDGKPLAAPEIVTTKPVYYVGAGVDRLSIQVAVPQYAGVYRVEFVRQGSDHPAAVDDLLVQEP